MKEDLQVGLIKSYTIMDIFKHLTKDNYPPYGVTKVSQYGKWGIMQYSTQRMLTDFVYTELEYFMQGCAIFKKTIDMD